MATVTDRRPDTPPVIPGPRPKQIAVGTILTLLVVVAFYDGLVLAIGGDDAVTTTTWIVLRTFPGTAIVGLTYLALGFAVAFTAGFEARPLWLVWVVTFGTFVYGGVAVSFVLSWFWTWPEVVLTSITKPLLICAIYIVVRRALLPPRDRTRR